MHFAYPLPWWAFVLLLAVAVLTALAGYGVGAHAGRKRLLLATLRSLALLLLLLVLFRPLLVADQRDPRGAVVPILVDQSRSMRIADAEGRRRIDAAIDLLRGTLLPRLTALQPQVLGFGDVVSATDAAHLASPDAPLTDFDAALRSVRDRYRGRPIAGIVLISDGGETRSPGTNASEPPLAPVYAIGVGGAAPDREVASVTANRSVLASSAIDLDATVVSRGLGTQPFDVRLMLGDEVVDVRRVTPVDGAAMSVRFTVTPDRSPAVYTVEVPVDSREIVRENNAASVLVKPPARTRRVLFVEGAPGFEHSFMRRAWAADPALDVDWVIRKGKNDQGQDIFLVQADPARTAALVAGFPTTKAALFGYDAVVFGSVEWDFLTRDQLAMTADFVRERGGGVMVLGARSFASPGLAGTPLEEALPLDLAPGHPAVALTATATTGSSADNKLRLTAEGRADALMRVALSPDESARQWDALPPLAATNVLGPPKPGASVLASAAVAGVPRPVVAIQRYGRGRTLEFAGEGSWHWKMLMPAASRTHEIFWRQALRWLSADSPDPVSVATIDDAQPGRASRLDVLVADGDFRPVAGATVTLRITGPDGQARTVNATLADRAAGRYTARVDVERAGSYHVEADARQSSLALGAADAWFLAGAVDPEFADPRLNEATLRRLADDSGGRYVRANQADDINAVPDLLARGAATAVVRAQPRDIWQSTPVFLLIAGLLGSEWLLRRRWGGV